MNLAQFHVKLQHLRCGVAPSSCRFERLDTGRSGKNTACRRYVYAHAREPASPSRDNTGQGLPPWFKFTAT